MKANWQLSLCWFNFQLFEKANRFFLFDFSKNRLFVCQLYLFSFKYEVDSRCLCVKCNNRKYTKLFFNYEAENCMFKGIGCLFRRFAVIRRKGIMRVRKNRAHLSFLILKLAIFDDFP